MEIKINQKVHFGGCEWWLEKKVGDKYLLRSVNKNVNDVLADPQNVKPLKEEK